MDKIYCSECKNCFDETIKNGIICANCYSDNVVNYFDTFYQRVKVPQPCDKINKNNDCKYFEKDK